MPGIAIVAFRVYFCKAETKHKNPLKIPQTEKKMHQAKLTIGKVVTKATS